MATRSVGISPGVPWAGPLPGGGYQGKTKSLDEAVARLADWLEEHIDGMMEIRFNSHGLSGGAYIYPGQPKTYIIQPPHSPQIGLGASLVRPEVMCERRHLERIESWPESTPINYQVLVYPQFLRDPKARGEMSQGESFGYWRAKTPQEAKDLLVRLVSKEVFKKGRLNGRP